ncbi:MAG: AAA family ATPase [Thermoplasmatales archaeon]|nr:flagellar hook-basal body complex protein FliE [Candidatus Thermoplasmatota archaeon]MDA8054433.1 AAA family ATPase [Thermoplasmatales archaeon]
MKAKAILIIGMPGSGKDEFAIVAREMGIEVVNMGDIVREYTNSIGVSISLSGEIASRERKNHGMDIWAKRTIEHIKSNFVVVEGVRNIEEIVRFRKDMEIGLVVGISSGRDTRFGRLLKRGREDDPRNIEEFAVRENRELSWGIGEVIATADRYICNDSTIQDFRESVREFLREHTTQESS